MNRSFSRAVAGCLILLSASAASAADNFTISITTNNGSQQNQVSSSVFLGFSNVQSLINELKNNQLMATVPGYTQTSIANGQINFRGLIATASYPTNGTLLIFTLPKAGINESFQGQTRDDSQSQLANFLEHGNLYGRIINALVASSPTEPLAGNPNSLMAQMAGNDFATAFGMTSSAGVTTTASGTTGSTTNLSGGQVGLGLAYSHFTSGGIPVDSFTIPLSYTFRFERDPRYVLIIEMPVSFSSSGGADAAALSLGIGLSIPLTDNWSIIPKVSAGATGSVDLGSGGVLVSGSVTSAYRFKARDYDFVLGNMVGVAQSVGITIGEYSIDPHITNEYMKNGLMVSRPLGLMGVQSDFLHDAEAQVWAVDTRFAGSALYDDSFQEFGFSLGKPLPTFGRYVRLGATYFHSHHSDGAMVNFGYTF